MSAVRRSSRSAGVKSNPSAPFGRSAATVWELANRDALMPRKEALKAVAVPALVIHGDADPLVPGISPLDNFYARQHEDGEICREIDRTTGKDFVEFYDISYDGYRRSFDFFQFAQSHNICQCTNRHTLVRTGASFYDGNWGVYGLAVFY